MMPVQVEAADSMAAAFAGAAIAASIFILYGSIALCAAVMHTQPGLTQFTDGKQFLVLAGIGLGFAAVCFIVGMVAGKATTR